MQRFLQLYTNTFGEGSITFNLHCFSHCVEYREKHGPMWQYSTGKFESMYSKLKKCYEGNCRNVPKQIHMAFPATQITTHHCKRQETLTLAQTATTRTNDTVIFHKEKFWTIVHKTKTHVIVQRLNTRPLNTDRVVPLPWQFVEVHKVVKLVGNKERNKRYKIPISNVKAKGVLCSNIVSSMHPQWIITWCHLVNNKKERKYYSVCVQFFYFFTETSSVLVSKNAMQYVFLTWFHFNFTKVRIH